MATRSLSALVVALFVLSAVAGLMFLSMPARALGDLTVVNGTYTIEGITQPIDGNVTVGSGGELIIRDGTLSIISNGDLSLRHHVTVQDGGRITLEHGTITVYLDQIDPWPFLTVTVTGGSELVATEGSALVFPGTLTVDGGSTLELRDSTVTALDSGLVDEFVVGGALGITRDDADDGPAITVTDSELNMFDSSIDALPEYETMAAVDLVLTGTSTLLAVNSYVSADFVSETELSHNVLALSDMAQAYLYGVSFEEYMGTPADRSPAIEVTGITTNPAIPTAVGAADNTLQDLDWLASVDTLTYAVNAQKTMELESWDTSSVNDALPVNSATIIATFYAESDYEGSRSVEWALEGNAYQSTGITPSGDDTVPSDRYFTLPIGSVTDVYDVRTLDVRFVNDGGAGTGSVYFDRIWVVFSVGSQAYIYRWLNVTVGDEYGVPMTNATVSAQFTGATEFEGQEALYYTTLGTSTVPPTEVLDYLGETADTYRITNQVGKAAIPYLTDIIGNGGALSSLFLGSYAITGSKTVDSVVYSSMESFSFPAYPAMSSSDQSFDFTVEVLGIVAESPDPSRWLSVSTGELIIEGMTFYHAGDVIVAGDGTLIIRNAEFLLVQSSAYERTIYVDGTATLLLDNAMMTSDLPMNLIVQGSGTLLVTNGSTMSGIEVEARENANVILDESEMDGPITTSWDSMAVIEVYDTILSAAPVLSGNSVGSFTNTSVPSVQVEDDAVANIYRWIHVKVYDGAGHALPGALVSARFFINETYWSSALSDSTGVAQVNSLATVITSTGSTYVGVYKVNATYWYAGVPYESDQELWLGVKPYTEPLEKNATYGILTISSTLPDLIVADVTAYPDTPKKGQEVTVTATVENVGVVGAYDVLVEFYHTVPGLTEMYHSAVIPLIGPGESVDVEGIWIATAPLTYPPHNLSVVADPLNTIPELDETPAMDYVLVTVLELPDLILSSLDVYTIPSIPVVDTPVELVAVIYNDGDQYAYNVTVEFYNGSAVPENLIGVDVLPLIASGTSAAASYSWTPPVVMTYSITVLVNPEMAFDEITFANNNATVTVTVYDHPDLEFGTLYFSDASGSVAGGESIILFAPLDNREVAPVVNPEVDIYVQFPDEAMELVETIIVSGTFTSMGNPITVQYVLNTDLVEEDTVVEVYMEVNPDHVPVELNYLNNIVHASLLILDIREDFAVQASGIHFTDTAGVNVTGAMYGSTVTLYAEVENLGARSSDNFTVSFGLIDEWGNLTIGEAYGEVLGYSTTMVWFNWTSNRTVPGTYTLWVHCDLANVVAEKNESNNYASTDFEVLILEMSATVIPGDDEFEAGESMAVVVTVKYTAGAKLPVEDLDGFVVQLVNSDGEVAPVPLLADREYKTDEDGRFTALFEIPGELETDQYTVRVVFEDADFEEESAPIQINGITVGGGIPDLLWIIIIIVVVAVVAGFILYTYVYGLGKLVECGECGAFIPAASKRCPKCGVEFEAGTMKCSECGAWVPADSSECPNCGVKFVGEELGEEDYLEQMRKEYDEMVSKYRELAKAELGKKFSDKKFEEWWKTQPTYITFDDWLAKEEEKRKEGPVPCPVCGTLNPKEATVCHKCGTVFGGEKGAPPGGKAPPPAAPPAQPAEAEQAPAAEPAQPGAAPRMVIRRPIDRKVVPKKIIKTPVGGEGGESQNGGEGQ